MLQFWAYFVSFFHLVSQYFQSHLNWFIAAKCKLTSDSLFFLSHNLTLFVVFVDAYHVLTSFVNTSIAVKLIHVRWNQGEAQGWEAGD